MKRLLLSLILFFPALASAQELHTFSNGEVADAEKINENFQYVLENATGSGGCSVIQQDNSVLIECADGTEATLGGLGNTYQLPVSEQGQVPDITLPNGQIWLVDNNDVELARYYSKAGDAYRVYISGSPSDGSCIFNDNDEQAVVFLPCVYEPNVYYVEDDCSGVPLGSVGYRRTLYFLDGVYMAYPSGVEATQTLLKSKRRSRYLSSSGRMNDELPCTEIEDASGVAPLIEYIPAPEITNAAHPVRLEQLP